MSGVHVGRVNTRERVRPSFLRLRLSGRCNARPDAVTARGTRIPPRPVHETDEGRLTSVTGPVTRRTSRKDFDEGIHLEDRRLLYDFAYKL